VARYRRRVSSNRGSGGLAIWRSRRQVSWRRLDGLLRLAEAHEDDAERAVRAGLAIVEEVAALNGRLAPERKINLSVRVGVQSGSVVMGHSGGQEPDIFGDAPNVASRVQSAAEPGSVLITAAVLDLVSGLFVVEDRGAHKLKGIEHPVQLYRAIQPSLARRRTHRAAVEPFRPSSGGKTRCAGG